jgi:hypothetical protein
VAAGHVVAPEPTSAGRCGLKLQLTWQRVVARLAPCLALELVCGSTRSSGYRHFDPRMNTSAIHNMVYITKFRVRFSPRS